MCGFLVCVMCAFLGCVMCFFSFCYVQIFEIVLCAAFRRWLAASRLAARFARVSRFARLLVTLTSVRGVVYDLTEFERLQPNFDCECSSRYLFCNESMFVVWRGRVQPLFV